MTSTRLGGVTLLLITLASCRGRSREDVFDWPLPPQAHACVASPNVRASAPIAPLRPGRYELTVVAIEGSRAGRTVRGRLWLTPTSAIDRSPRTGQQVPKPDMVRSPLYGATDVALDSVGAPIVSDGISPRPRSTDPIYPGVLVLMDGGFYNQPKGPVVLIATLGNLRNGHQWLDGGGIGLFVHSNTGANFAGEWGPWGIVRNGSGYFCTSAVQ